MYLLNKPPISNTYVHSLFKYTLLSPQGFLLVKIITPKYKNRRASGQKKWAK